MTRVFEFKLPPIVVPAKYRHECPKCHSKIVEDIPFFPVKISADTYSTKFSCCQCFHTYIPLPEEEL